ncbi:ABC transporter permease [Vagococcus coleopterorum]|uniref:Transport permease protein n=1 Tax=Vagococcus coleopterorum TaxID=2714946 RepID=A0A6G8ALP0_9ENTE|nr:ABC transporter permease [Vagococcus coleopterorum]QIL45845.1 ABC transporter permease [Vagococcus coleopterorum]
MNQLVKLTVLNIKRTFRDVSYILMVIGFPLMFYVLYTQMFSGDVEVNGIPWVEYSLISMIAFGIVGNALSNFGVSLADEKSEGWYDFLKVSPIPESIYIGSQLLASILVSTVSMILMFVAAYLIEGISYTPLEYILFIIIMQVASIVFLALATIIGQFGRSAKPISLFFYLGLSLLGGLWMPVIAMPEGIQKIVTKMPTYHFAEIAHSIQSKQGLNMKSVGILIVYTIVFFVIGKLIANKKR